MLKKVAVIIPAYNAEKYLEKNLKSILGQTYRNISVFIVNDGSSDATAQIISSMVEKDGRLTLITVPNGGPAKARNVGLQAAQGKADYILFSDADDELLPDSVERSVAAAEASGADLVLSGFTIMNRDGTGDNYCEPSAVYSPENFGDSFADLYKANLLNQVWAKLFSAGLIYSNNITFPDYRWGEDRLFVFDCIEKAGIIAVDNYCGYRYIMHPGESLITGFYDKKATVCALADIRAAQLCEKYGIEDDGYFRYMFAKSIFSCMTNLFSKNCHLSRNEKIDYVNYIIQNDYIIDRCSGASGGLPIKIVVKIMSTRSSALNMMAAHGAAFVGNALPGLFQKIKHKK